MIVDQSAVQEIKQIVVDELLRRTIDEIAPRTLLEIAQQTLRFFVQLQVVLGDVAIQVLAAQHFLDLPQLLEIVLAAEEGRAVEHDAEKHARERPDVQRVVVILRISSSPSAHVIVREQLGALVVARAHTHVVLLIYASRSQSLHYAACSSPPDPSR